MPRRPRHLIALAAAGLVAGAAAAPAQEGGALTAPQLGAATNFGQGWQPEVLEAARALPLRLFRDAVYWADVEKGGAFIHDGPRETFPDLLDAAGAGMVLVVNNGHPDHDGGHTPLTPEAVAAFARHAAEMVRRFPAIVAVEVGNEMNSRTFVSGPGWADVSLQERGAAYAALLAATAAAVRAVRPEVRIYGGAAHSLPLAWFRALFEAGAAQHMDALVIHPYTVAPEQLAAQVALLRAQLPEAADLPLAVTEFGTEDHAAAPAHLLKFYCQMALSNVETAIWYAANRRGDGLVPLLGPEGAPTGAGRAFQIAADLFAGRPVTPLAPDPFTYGCRFGEDAALIWGEPRALRVNGVQVYDAEGAHLPPKQLTLSMQAPLVLVSDGAPLWLGETLALGAQEVLADSSHQFAWPGRVDTPFRWLIRAGDEERAMELRPGQEKDGVPWTPYLGTSLDGVARAGPGWVLPSLPPSGPVEIVLRYEAPQAMPAHAKIHIGPSTRSEDGVTLRVTLDGDTLLDRRVIGPEVLDFTDLALQPGSRMELAVGPGPSSARGDVTGLRLTLRRPTLATP
jgi:hypothetical protein